MNTAARLARTARNALSALPMVHANRAASSHDARTPKQAPAVSALDAVAAIRAGLARCAGGPRGVLTFDQALAVICEATGWPVGHVWVHGPTGWRSSGSWFALPAAGGPAGADRYTPLREATAITDLGSGRGIVAAVLHLEACRFLPGLQGVGSPLRQAHAQALGLAGVVGVPVRTTVDGHRKVTAILEFITPYEVEPDGALAEVLLEVATRARRRATRKPAPPAPPAAATTSLDIEIPNHLAG